MLSQLDFISVQERVGVRSSILIVWVWGWDDRLKQKLQCSVVLQLTPRNHNRKENSEHNDVQAFQAAWMMTKHDGISLHEFALKLPVCLFQVWSGARDGGDRNMERNPICLEHSFQNPQKHWPEWNVCICVDIFRVVCVCECVCIQGRLTFVSIRRFGSGMRGKCLLGDQRQRAEAKLGHHNHRLRDQIWTNMHTPMSRHTHADE